MGPQKVSPIEIEWPSAIFIDVDSDSDSDFDVDYPKYGKTVLER